jgi:predicted double-glycine peptidase
VKLRIPLTLLVIVLVSATLALAADTAGNWIDVPFVMQSKDGCGSAAISMILQYWAGQSGKAVSSVADARQIQELLFVPAEKGVPASAMRDYFHQSGYRTYAFRGEWSDLQHHISQGRPLIVSLRASGPRGPLHYALVVGLDWERNYVFLNDPIRGKMFRISRDSFLAEWNPANNWTLLAIPTGD